MKNKNANFEHLTAIVDAFYEEPSLMLLILCVLDVLMRPYFISTDLPHIVINFILTNKNEEIPEMVKLLLSAVKLMVSKCGRTNADELPAVLVNIPQQSVSDQPYRTVYAGTDDRLVPEDPHTESRDGWFCRSMEDRSAPQIILSTHYINCPKVINYLELAFNSSGAAPLAKVLEAPEIIADIVSLMNVPSLARKVEREYLNMDAQYHFNECDAVNVWFELLTKHLHRVFSRGCDDDTMEVLWAHDIQTGFMGAGMLYESQLREKAAQKEEK